MSELDSQFEQAAKDVNNLKTRPENNELLDIYGLYKQATVGDCNQPKPNMFHVKDKAKHEFWVKRKGLSQEDAKKEYVALVRSLIEKYGLKE